MDKMTSFLEGYMGEVAVTRMVISFLKNSSDIHDNKQWEMIIHRVYSQKNEYSSFVLSQHNSMGIQTVVHLSPSLLSERTLWISW